MNQSGYSNKLETQIMSKNKEIEEKEEPELCPLCAEELESDDLEFKPCKCGYQVRKNNSNLRYVHFVTIN